MNRLELELELRGFFVTEKEGAIRFSDKNHPDDIVLLKRQLKKLQIDHTFKGNDLIVADDQLDNDVIKQLIWSEVRNTMTPAFGFRMSSSFVKFNGNSSISTFHLEAGVALLVKSLNAAGISTLASCDGHGEKAPSIMFNGR
ncbi:hypothetical protein CR203_22805 [Salipaludibacillus neizhouensis]|uniref:Uncharacterized protein n=1 Tax=Salipaludibacillus neizhouensis TaxID=885475 RepID=A0A3A9K277_9BACI|nr:hypothetical protein [Salipaludibacillus neizhouensis]RKL65030.1 hypothetical protein CR203_22805 [Salipaludibacillus neizhouensis]